MGNTMGRPRAGFSRIDLVVVIAIILIVWGLLSPSVCRVTDAAARTQTANNLKQCALGVHNAHDQNKYYPPFFGYYGNLDVKSSPNKQASIFVHLLPYVGEAALYITCVADPNNANNVEIVVPAYLSPLDYTEINNGGGTVNFAVNLRLWQTTGLNNLQAPTIDRYDEVGQPAKVRMPATFNPDGTCNTILFATKLQVCGSNTSTLINGQLTFTPADPSTGTVADVATINGPYFGWTNATLANQSSPAANLGWQPAPQSSTCTANSSLAQSFYPQAIQVALCDASVRSVSTSVSFGSWTMALTPNGGERFQDDWIE